MSLDNRGSRHRPPRVSVRRRRPAVAPAGQPWLNANATRNRRARSRSAGPIRLRTRSRTRDPGHRLPLGIELCRLAILIALAVVAVIVVLPALLEFAAAPLP